MAKATRIPKWVRMTVVGLTAAAIVQELRKPDRERTWNGRVAGIVPYDFRVPTFERVRASWWNPDDERIITPGVFGVGWTVNFGRVLRLLGVI
jgi:hypothetical protein